MLKLLKEQAKLNIFSIFRALACPKKILLLVSDIISKAKFGQYYFWYFPDQIRLDKIIDEKKKSDKLQTRPVKITVLFQMFIVSENKEKKNFCDR